MLRILCASLTCLAMSGAVAVHAQSLNERVLVVYNADDAESLSVARHYQTARSIPSANLCAIQPASSTTLTLAQFETSVRAPVRTCLEASGRRNILYIVLSWGMPYRLTVDSRVFAVDSALADIWDDVSAEFAAHPDVPASTNPYYSDAQTLGNIYPDFVPFSLFRQDGSTETIYSVWRLDGATPTLARGLVDKAIRAESSGLAGMACFDRNRGNIELAADAGYLTGDHDLARAASFARQAGFTTIEDANTAEFGTSPAPLRCDGAALYAGWYSYNNYPRAFTWNTGAIGFHLDSGSALDPRGGNNFTAQSIQNGITITGGAVNEPYLSGMVHPDVFYRALFAGSNAGDAMLRSLPWLKWMVLSVGDPLYRPFPGGRAPFNTGRLEDGLRVSPVSVLGGAAVTGTVFLSQPAPSGGAVVSLSSAVRTVASVPSTVTVPPGQRSASFAISTIRPTEDYSVRIDATYGSVVRRNSVSVVPLLGSITQMQSSSVTGGGSRLYRMELNGPAPAEGLTVAISSDSAAGVPPANVRFAPGERSQRFTVSTTPVNVNTLVTVSATDGRTTRKAAFTVLAPAASSLVMAHSAVASPGTSTGTVRLTGPAPAGGTTVTLTSSSTVARVPESIVVPPGSTSGTFAVTIGAVAANTTVTITARAGNVSRSATVTAMAGFSVRLDAARVMGGAKATLTITMGARTTSGTTLALVSTNAAVVTVPPTATIPAGASSVAVQLQTFGVAAETAAEIRVSSGSQLKSATLSVTPVLVRSSYIPSTLKGGAASGGEVYLGAVAGTSVSLAFASSHPNVSVPAQITIPAGSWWTKFPISTPGVTSNLTFTVTFTGPSNTIVSKLITVTP